MAGCHVVDGLKGWCGKYCKDQSTELVHATGCFLQWAKKTTLDLTKVSDLLLYAYGYQYVAESVCPAPWGDKYVTEGNESATRRGVSYAGGCG